MVPENPGPDVPASFAEALEHLRALLKECDETKDTVTLFARIAQHLVEPMHAMCKKTAEKIRHASGKTPSWLGMPLFSTRVYQDADPEWDACLFLIHCLLPLVRTIRAHDELYEQYARIYKDLSAASKKLCELHYQNMLAGSGLKKLGCGEISEPTFLVEWNAFCAAPNLLFPSERLVSLKDTSLRSTIHRAALLHLVQSYTRARAQSHQLPPERDIAMLMDVLDIIDEAPHTFIEQTLQMNYGPKKSGAARS